MSGAVGTHGRATAMGKSDNLHDLPGDIAAGSASVVQSCQDVDAKPRRDAWRWRTRNQTLPAAFCPTRNDDMEMVR